MNRKFAASIAATAVLAVSMFTQSAGAQGAPAAKMSPEQAKENAYASVSKPILWGFPTVLLQPVLTEGR